MKQLLFVCVLSLCAPLAYSQGFDNFWHARPKVSQKLSLSMGTGVFEFKPSVVVSATMLRKAETGGVQSSFLNAAGFGIAYVHSYQDASGYNYSDYGFTLALLATGNSDQGPTFQPSLALTVGILNNLVSFGPGYEMTSLRPAPSRFFFLVSIGLLPTMN